MPCYLPKHPFLHISVLSWPVTYLFSWISRPSVKRPTSFTHTGTQKPRLLRKHRHEEQYKVVIAAADQLKKKKKSKNNLFKYLKYKACRIVFLLCSRDFFFHTYCY